MVHHPNSIHMPRTDLPGWHGRSMTKQRPDVFFIEELLQDLQDELSWLGCNVDVLYIAVGKPSHLAFNAARVLGLRHIGVPSVRLSASVLVRVP